MQQANTGPELISRYVLLNDIASSSRLMEEYPHEYNELLDRHNQLFLTTSGEFGGEIIKHTGDGYYVFFESFADCVAYAHELAKQFAKFPAISADDRFQVRIVIHAGEIRPALTEYYGPALNRASRLCGICHPGQILVSGEALATDCRLPAGWQLNDLGYHHLRDLGRPEHLYQLISPELPVNEFPALETLNSRPTNLCEQPSAFIGRVRELEELAGLLDLHRLVTITAPGGYGKSRVAAHLCVELLADFKHGVFYVELAPLRNHLSLAPAIANATGYHFFGTRRPEQQIIDFLRGKEMLLCFDNLEHLLECASFISEILKEAPGVRAIVTSREALHVSGEQVYALEPLSVDDAQSDAVLLFADRASLVHPAFRLGPDNQATVGAVCRRLEGIPLAIELAAAWMDSFTITELQNELDHQLELTARITDLPERHHSLRASLDWSWSLLTEQQQDMLMSMAVFRGGCFGEAAAAVLGVPGLARRQGLATLVDKSWLFTREIDGRTRYHLRDAASREYSLQKLEATRGAGAGSRFERVVRAHAGHYSELMGCEGETLHGPEQLAALQWFRLEKQNIYEALDTLLKRWQPAESGGVSCKLLAPFARWLWEFLDMRSSYREMAEHYQAIRQIVEQTDQPGQLQIWSRLGCCRGASRLGQFSAARDDASLAIKAAEAQGTRPEQAVALGYLGNIEYQQGNFDAARGLLNQSLTISRETGDRTGTATALSILGIVDYLQSNYPASARLHSEALAIMRETGDRAGIAVALGNLGNLELAQGNYGAARELYTETLAFKRTTGDRAGTAAALGNLGIVTEGEGDFDAAHELSAESLAIFREIGERRSIAISLVILGNIEMARGNYETARDLHTKSLAIKREIGDQAGIESSLINLASFAILDGQYDLAQQQGAEALAISREIDDQGRTADPLSILGIVAYMLGEYGTAHQQHSAALAIRRETGDRPGIITSLINLGAVECRQGNLGSARARLREALPLSREIGNFNSSCECLAFAAYLCATAGQLFAGGTCLFGVRHHAAESAYILEPMDNRQLELAADLIEHPATGLAPAEAENLQTRAGSLSLDELAEFALNSLRNLSVD